MLLASLQALARSEDAAPAAAAEALALEHRGWLESEIRHFVDRVVDPGTGLVRSDRHYSAHRDTFKNRSTAYANAMVAVLARTVAETGWGPDLLSHHFEAQPGDGGSGESRSRDWGSLLRRHFWTGGRFRDQLGTEETSGEANVVPFWAGLIDDRPMQAAALETLRREGYTEPYPLRFSTGSPSIGLLLAYRLWSPDYQTTTSWTSLGSMYLALLGQTDPAAAAVALGRMRELIEEHGTFWEVIDGEGEPWRSRSRLSVSDVSMLWGAILLEALEALEAG